MLSHLVGKYQMVESNRYDDFLKSVGAGMIERSQSWKFTPLIEWAPLDDGKWKQKTVSGVKNSEINFVPGEEFEEELFGRRLKSTITLDGNRLIHKQMIGPVEVTMIREFNDYEMTTTFTVGDIIATRVFRKIN